MKAPFQLAALERPFPGTRLQHHHMIANLKLRMGDFWTIRKFIRISSVAPNTSL